MQITVGNTPLYRHFQSTLPPTVKCRNVPELPGLPSHPKGHPSRQDNGTPNPLQTYLQGTFPAPLPKKCYGWHTNPPLESLQGNSGVPSSWKGRGKEGEKWEGTKKGGRKTTFHIIIPTDYREEYSFSEILFAQCSSNVNSNSYSCTYHWVVTNS